jgi:hypothetical protein
MVLKAYVIKNDKTKLYYDVTGLKLPNLKRWNKQVNQLHNN